MLKGILTFLNGIHGPSTGIYLSSWLIQLPVFCLISFVTLRWILNSFQGWLLDNNVHANSFIHRHFLLSNFLQSHGFPFLRLLLDELFNPISSFSVWKESSFIPYRYMHLFPWTVHSFFLSFFFFTWSVLNIHKNISMCKNTFYTVCKGIQENSLENNLHPKLWATWGPGTWTLAGTAQPV